MPPVKDFTNEIENPIFAVLKQRLGTNGINRIQRIVDKNPRKRRIFYDYLTKIHPIFFSHHLASFEYNLNLTKGMTRYSGADAFEHYLNVALEGMNRKKNYNYHDTTFFQIGMDHDPFEDEVEQDIKKGKFAPTLEKLKSKEPSKEDEDFLKAAIVGMRQDLIKNYLKEVHGEIIREIVHFGNQKPRGYDKFLKNHAEGIDLMTRYASTNDNYASYVKDRIYSGNIYVPAKKWDDATNNINELWGSISLKKDLSIEELAEVQKFLIKYRGKKEYTEEKKRLSKKFKEINEASIKSSAWRLNYLQKALIHIYMGKSFLKKNRGNELYSSDLKPRYELMLKTAYEMAVRERLFLFSYHPDLSIDKISNIEDKWVKYMPQGLNQIEITGEETDKPFEGTIESTIKRWMGKEFFARVLPVAKPVYTVEKLYEIALIIESSIGQNFKGADLIKDFEIDSKTKLWKLRDADFYATNLKRKIKMEYNLNNFDKLEEIIR